MTNAAKRIALRCLPCVYCAALLMLVACEGFQVIFPLPVNAANDPTQPDGLMEPMRTSVTFGTPQDIFVLTNDTNMARVESIVAQPSKGTAALSPDGQYITYTPTSSGPDMFTYQARSLAAADGSIVYRTANVYLTVSSPRLPAYTPPQATNDPVNGRFDVPVNAPFSYDVLTNDTSSTSSKSLVRVDAPATVDTSSASRSGIVNITPTNLGPLDINYTMTDGQREHLRRSCD